MPIVISAASIVGCASAQPREQMPGVTHAVAPPIATRAMSTARIDILFRSARTRRAHIEEAKGRRGRLSRVERARRRLRRMGTWDEGILDNDTSLDGLGDLRHEVTEDVV